MRRCQRGLSGGWEAVSDCCGGSSFGAGMLKEFKVSVPAGLRYRQGGTAAAGGPIVRLGLAHRACARSMNKGGTAIIYL